MLMHAHDRRVDRGDPVQLPALVSQRLHRLEHSGPDALRGPPGEVLIARVPAVDPLRDLPPGWAGPVPPGGSFDDSAWIRRGPAGGLRLREQRADHCPGLVRYLSACHKDRLADDRRSTL